jgi:DNA-directed RNA polymerase specialized sigma24 family protein
MLSYNSCFSHAVAIAEGKFLSKLSLAVKKKNTKGEQEDVPIISPPSNTSTGEVDPDADDEDTEDEIDALLQELEAAVATLPPDSEQAKLLAGLLLKVRGFIAKVSSI